MASSSWLPELWLHAVSGAWTRVHLLAGLVFSIWSTFFPPLIVCQLNALSSCFLFTECLYLLHLLPLLNDVRYRGWHTSFHLIAAGADPVYSDTTCWFSRKLSSQAIMVLSIFSDRERGGFSILCMIERFSLISLCETFCLVYFFGNHQLD